MSKLLRYNWERLVRLDTECGFWRIHHTIGKTLRSCRAQQNTRYSLRAICAEDGALIATEGRQLVRIKPAKVNDKFNDGLYHFSTENLLIPVPAESNLKFPQWKMILPGEEKAVKIFEITKFLDEARWLTEVFSALAYMNFPINLQLFFKTFESFALQNPQKTVIRYYASDRPIRLDLSFTDYHMIYVVMPIAVQLATDVYSKIIEIRKEKSDGENKATGSQGQATDVGSGCSTQHPASEGGTGPAQSGV